MTKSPTPCYLLINPDAMLASRGIRCSGQLLKLMIVCSSSTFARHNESQGGPAEALHVIHHVRATQTLSYTHHNVLEWKSIPNTKPVFKVQVPALCQLCLHTDSIKINQSKRKTSNANGQTNLGHKHKAPDHNHEATQPMVDLPHTS